MEKVKRLLKKNDIVQVIAGKDKGKRGKIISLVKKKGRVIVEGVNIMKRHTRPSQAHSQGGIIEKEMPISWSNVMIYCDKCAKPVRVGKKVLSDGSKIRYCKKCGESIEGK
ncbi:MAG: 50S ribosomal protein L24 [Candidatus Schekmanbacteria bacterium]|nr:MAG: 50S ribosomal protein L24 [Candidatus Schekmanbacteria bacterium]